MANDITECRRPGGAFSRPASRAGAAWRFLAWGLAVAALVAILSGTALAKEDYSFIGIEDASQVPKFITSLQKAVAAGDKQAVAGMVSYPLMVTLGGQDVELDGAAAFVARYDQIMTEAVKASVLAQGLKPEDVFVNRQGVMVGDSGQIWVLPDGDVLRISEIREP